MKIDSSYYRLKEKLSFLKVTVSKKIKTSVVIFTSLLLFSAMPFFMGPGLDTPEQMGVFLNGNFPAESTTTAEPYRVAFPNVTFFYPITFKTVPLQDKLVIGQLDGQIFWIENDESTTNKNLIADLSTEVGITADAGFLGLTIHPNFGNGDNYFYVYYTTKNSDGENEPSTYATQNCDLDDPYTNFVILERFEVDPTTLLLVPGSRINLLKNRMNGTTHRGGGMDFGDDGFLYLTVGDQAAWRRAQNMTSNLDGGVLRLDVDKDPSRSHPPIRKKPQDTGDSEEESGIEYWIPNDNPFLSADGSTFEEYYSVGLRNPFRMTKDSQTGIFYIGDVGLDSFEEINVLGSGLNYGWPLFEGDGAGPGCVTQLLYNMSHEGPLTAFPRDRANSITGGYVYRGTNIPEYFGKYICSDYGQGDELFSVDLSTGNFEEIGNFLPRDIIAFGEDYDNELYLLKAGQNTTLYKMKSTDSEISYDLFPQLLSEAGIFTDLNTLAVTDGIIPYDLIESFWSDGALKRRWLAIPNNGTYNTSGEQIDYSENGDWDFPEGTVIIKHFDLKINDNNPNITRKIETRLSIMRENGKFYFLTYNWNEGQTDATLQSIELDEPIDITTTTGGIRTQTWHFPSNTECLTCHSDANKGSLGLRSRYLNKDYTYSETGITANQLVTLSHLGIIDEEIIDSDTPNILTSKSIYDANATLDEKARSYLDLNCAYCHRPESENRAAFDLRLFNSLEATNILNAGVLTTLGITDEEIIFPGNASKSILYHRMNSVDLTIMMPPLSKSIVDNDVVILIENWINQLEAPADDLNSPDTNINLALLPSAQVEGSETGGRGTPKEILYDPRIDDYYVTTDRNEYGVGLEENLGTIDIDDAFEWKVSWQTAKNINYITFGGIYPSSGQNQPNTNWKISYKYNNVWSTLDEGQGGWLDGGIFEWGSILQSPILADEVKVQAFSNGMNEVDRVSFTGRGGISTISGDDSATFPKASLFQYLPLPTECTIISITVSNQTDCQSVDNNYTQELILEYINSPESATFNINNQIFAVTSSPQTVTLTDLQSNGEPVDISAYISSNENCTITKTALFTAPELCNSGIPNNSQDNSINLGLLDEALIIGTESGARGTRPHEILYDPAINNYRTVTAYNEYGTDYLANLGKPNAENGFSWKVNWLNSKYINYITFGGVYTTNNAQSQPNTLWRIGYHTEAGWLTLEEGRGGWIDGGIYEWGGDTQVPIIADAVRVQLYSDNENGDPSDDFDLISVHLRGRGGNSSNGSNDSATTPKATLIQYIPYNISCDISGLDPGIFVFCDGIWVDNNKPGQNTALSDIYIGNGTYVILEDKNIEINNIEVATGASLIIEQGAGLIVNGDFTNNGSVELQSSSNKYSSLIIEGTATGNMSYKRHVNNYNGPTGNDLVSSPFNGETFGTFTGANPNLFENPGNTDQKLFGPFSETTGSYQTLFATANSTVTLDKGVGYRAARDASEDIVSGTTLTFTGTAETNGFTMPITESATSFSGWNLIGNPYPSYMDFDTFFNLNKTELDAGTYQAIYGYDGDASNGWTILNNLSTGTLIAPGQGFFVKVKSGGGTITFTPEMRVKGNTDDFIGGRTNMGLVKVEIDNTTTTFETDIYFNTNASLGLDPGYDASLFGGSAPDYAVYTHLVEQNTGTPIAIQAVGEDAMNNVVIPLGIHATQGENITVRIAEMTIPATVNVYLEDTSNNTFTLLNTNTYNFVADTDIIQAGRFFLRFESSSLNIDEQNLNGLSIYTNQSEKAIVIKGQLQNNTEFTLFDIHGRVINKQTLDTSSTTQTIDVANLSIGIYIVQLKNELSEKRIQKLIIR
ncbi:PQQ-dependent sugar dehydrogenase [uncultured Winogradskyella sp.]|uniref:PQQ-dependent sugar dehydrogenase n=1 Tax=uncultured Winogradskyella sp. TaxID=395353 RepID=UPI0030D87B00